MKKVIVCDLDGTLAESKSTLTESMAQTIRTVLNEHYFAVISGGDWPQFEKQFLSHFSGTPEQMKNLFLFPTSGAECMRYTDGTWQVVYDKLLTQEEHEKIFTAFETSIKDSGVEVSASSYGDIIEDRGEQVTFSGCGQHAPLEVKSVWDPDQTKRRAIIAELQKYIPEFEITMGGMTSIDITRKGVNKAYAIYKLEEILGVSKGDIVYIGDALYPGGNDTKARDAGVECIQVSGPEETEKVLHRFFVFDV
jgi:phosphomannomutase